MSTPSRSASCLGRLGLPMIVSALRREWSPSSFLPERTTFERISPSMSMDGSNSPRLMSCSPLGRADLIRLGSLALVDLEMPTAPVFLSTEKPNQSLNVQPIHAPLSL